MDVTLGADDHYYGPWAGGGAGEGGHPAGKGTMSATQADDKLQAAGFYGSDLTGVDEAAIPHIVASCESLAADYPHVVENMRVTVEASSWNDPRAYATTSVSTYNGVAGSHGLSRGDARIMVTKSQFADADALNAKLTADHEAGWIAGGNIDHVMTHEFGHVIDGALGNPSEQSNLMSGLSKYGDSDKGEGFAEAFASMRAGNTGPAESAVASILAGIK